MSGKRKLSTEQVIEAREMYRQKYTIARISELFGLASKQTKYALTGVSYKEVPGAISINEFRGKENPKGSLSGRATTDEETVIEIRKALEEGKSIREIAYMFDVSMHVVSKIARGKTWRHMGQKLNLDPLRNMDKCVRRGEKACHAQIDDITAGYIKWHLKIGVAHLLLAKYFKVTRGVIKNLSRGLTWKHIKPNKNAPPLATMRVTKKPMRIRGKRLEAKFEERIAVRHESFTDGCKSVASGLNQF